MVMVLKVLAQNVELFFFSLVHFIKLYTLECLALVGIKVVSERTYTDTYLEHHDYCARLRHYVLPEL